MSVRADLIKALDGETPERTPLTTYDFFFPNRQDPDFQALLDQGLGLTIHVGTVGRRHHGLETEWKEYDEGGRHYRVLYWKTPVGTVWQSWVNGWHDQAFVKEPADYRVLQWVVEHTELQPNYQPYYEQDALIGERGLVIPMGSRTPAMVINVDWAGTQRFGLDVALEVPELFALYEVMRRQFVEETRLLAAGPGKYVKWLENLTVSMIGPRRYRELLVNVYRECVPLLAAAGKRVMVHYDGALRAIRQEIAEAPFHAIESLTEPPEGDMTYDECRRAWPTKMFWGNINVALYGLPPAQFAEALVKLRERGGKRALALEISEDLPRNWRESVPVALRTLAELG